MCDNSAPGATAGGGQTVIITSEGRVNYFVIGPDGSKYGPADLATLNRWATEGRVSAASVLEEEGTGRRISAPQVPGLNLAMSAAPNAPPPWAQPPGPMPGYYRPLGSYAPNAGNTEIVLAWIFGAIGFIFCPAGFGTASIVLACIAKSKGQPKGTAAIVFGIASLVVGCTLGAIIWSRMGGFRRF